MLPNQVEDLLRLGANVSVDKNDHLPNQLEDFAKIAKAKGVHLTIRNASSLLPHFREGIAKIAGSHVTFEA